MDVENRAGLSRVNCGWKQPHLPLEWARRYWRDVHSPAVARRDGIYDYRHMQFDPVRTDLFASVAGITFACPADQQLMWISDVRYLDDHALSRFAACPDAEIRAHMLADIDRVVERSTSYRVAGSNGRTLIDETSEAIPAGPVSNPTFNLFLRSCSDEASFQAAVRRLARSWAGSAEVLRLRLALFEPLSGTDYTPKTPPFESQYQAWIELVVRDERATRALPLGVEAGRYISAIHTYPTPLAYSFVYDGKLTLIALRGYPAYEAIKAIGAEGQIQPSLLRWMYGAVPQGDFTSL
jgi:hypothetical protein